MFIHSRCNPNAPIKYPPEGLIMRQSDNKSIDMGHAWLDKSLPLSERFEDFKQYFEGLYTQQQRAIQAMSPTCFEEIKDERRIKIMASLAKDIKDGTLDARKLSSICDGLAYDIRESLNQDRKGFLSITIPKGVSNIDAIRAISEYSILRWPGIGHIFDAKGYPILEKFEADKNTGVLKERELKIMPFVKSTNGLCWTDQLEIIKREGFAPITLSEGILVGAVFACKEPINDERFDMMARRYPASPYHGMSVRCADGGGLYVFLPPTGYSISMCHKGEVPNIGTAGKALN
jgi:hypothetical protein